MKNDSQLTESFNIWLFYNGGEYLREFKGTGRVQEGYSRGTGRVQ